MSRKRYGREETVNDYPAHLRGFGQNRWGGQNTQSLKTYGGKFGPASQGRRLTDAERQAWAKANGYQ